MQSIEGPFGPAHLRETVSAATIAAMYRAKCDAEVPFAAQGIDSLDLYECQSTGMRFWRPEALAGDEAFYRQLSRKWPHYYQEWRWEYGPALRQLRSGDRLLEVGCGRGTFLRQCEEHAAQAEGLEYNREAIAGKVTRWPVRALDLSDLDAPEAFDVVCSFQVLEHVVDPAAFLHGCLASLRPGGRLIISTPDPENPGLAARQDAFDLPPHHMNQFPLASYRRIAALLGLRITRIDRAPFDPWGSRPPGTPRRDGLRTALRRGLRNLGARLRGQRGPTLMVTFVKRPAG
ncbi:MAG: class I SAM-dependent methyltransferase [Sphingomonadaceae bacterium]